MKKFFFPFLLISLFSAQLAAQVLPVRVVIVNGGRFGNPADDVNLSIYDLYSNSYVSLDTIRTESVQDVLVKGREVYVAAQDSIVKYDLISGQRVAAQAFGAPSTISLGLYHDYLLVGNWYAPFGQPGPFNKNFRIFNKNTLAFVADIPQIREGAKSFAVLGDTAYISQNLTSSSFSDSAGWMVKVDLKTLSYADSVAIGNGTGDLGRLLAWNGAIYGLNSSSNTLTVYNPATGIAISQPANADFSIGSAGTRLTLEANGVVHTVIDEKIATYDLLTRSIIAPAIVDTVITAFALDTVNRRYYITQTDFFSYTGGAIYSAQGQRLDTLLCGSSPEAIGIAYNQLPEARPDTFTISSGLADTLDVLANDLDDDALWSILGISIPPVHGTVSVAGLQIVYQPQAGYAGPDSFAYVVADGWFVFSDTPRVYLNVERAASADLLAETSIRLYPSPAREHLNLSFEQPWSGRVRLYSLQGQLLGEQEALQASNLRWQVAQLPAGLYLLRGEGPGGSWQRRWIKD
jgi:hypothetical protein